MLQAIVFDFDGVIVDSEPLHHRAFVEVAGPLGLDLDYPTYLREYIGYDDRDAFRAMLQQLGREPDDQTIAQLGHEKAAAFERLASEAVRSIPGAIELIRAATDAKLPIAIASGATRADIDLMLDALGLTHHFEVIVSADDVARSKPDPASYALAAERLAAYHPDANLQPGACLAIEDTAAGIASARGAGLMTLGLTTTGPAEALADAGRVIDSLAGVTIEQLRAWYDD
ncbi:MAG: HAD-IA family hydrolase [Planctomycetes bacterium]|jgi:beta-phosphoglucomutase|nr:HAD-IA family hydrolase [Planctomycetota bacterium]